MNKLYIKDSLYKIKQFFKKNKWEPLDFQIESWTHYLNGHNGIIQVPTGCGKTYASILAPLLKLSINKDICGINILFITPLKALSRDSEKSILEAINFFNKKITIGIRNGDTSNYEKKKQLIKPPNILITTPESLSLLISNKKSKDLFSNLNSIIIDEWHELMGNKRGNQCELNLSWLRGNKKDIQIWAMSATISNIDEASLAIVGLNAKKPKIINSNINKNIEIKSVIPKEMGTFPWSGHLGIKSHKFLLDKIDKNKSTLFFTNTRNQSERWFQCLKFFNPEMGDKIALHHGSLDKEERKNVEEGVKRGSIKWVVCTSSLDLGVDFQPVDQIVQIGSAKNLARLIQRAGRSAHKPEGVSKILFMPTNALELIEISAIKRILNKGITEKINLPELSYDVLLQHLVNLGCGPGFDPNIEKERIKECWSYRNICDEDWLWCLKFLEFGGKCLNAYPKYKKIEKKYSNKRNSNYRYYVNNDSIIRTHKFNIGTITSDKYMFVKYLRGNTLGTLEENFVSKLKKGDTFFFAGKVLEFIKIIDMTLFVKKSKKNSSMVPSWIGGQMAISDLLSENIRKEISICNNFLDFENHSNEELKSLIPILNRQKKYSDIPRKDQLLAEIFSAKNYKSLFVFTLEGKFVNEGIGFLWALRFSKLNKSTFNITANDFGFSLTSEREYDFSLIKNELNYFLNIDCLEKDLKSAINLSELTKKKFKKIAQISGLVNNNPSKLKTANQVQISSNLLFDVFTKYEDNHLLIKQAFEEVQKDQLEINRMKNCLLRMSSMEFIMNKTKYPSPLAFPLLVERLSSTLSNETIEHRVAKLINSYEK
tara:strand:- start:6532 stop:9006 length:2475 start_codon:yes stop_codon:yes gene_type:complete